MSINELDNIINRWNRSIEYDGIVIVKKAAVRCGGGWGEGGGNRGYLCTL